MAEVNAICGDVFWKKDFPENDPYASDKEKLRDSRKMILELADWVIPGHGKMFKVERLSFHQSQTGGRTLRSGQAYASMTMALQQ